MLPEDLLTNEIIATSLEIDKGKSARLLSWKHENCTKSGDNFFNVVKRINVRYLVNEIENQISYVAKINPCKQNDPFNPYRQRAMVKEMFFYNELLPALNSELAKLGQAPLRVPKCLHSSLDKEKEVIVFEDLRIKGFVTYARNENMDELHSNLMAKEISRLHAASFSLQNTLGNQDLKKVYPLLVESWVVGDPELRAAFEEVFKKGVTNNLNLVKALESFEEELGWLHRLIDTAMDTLLRELETSAPWSSIVHGDCHRANVLFSYDKSDAPNDVMIIDWQTVRVASLGSEINYLLYSSYFGPSRNLLFPTITETYFETYQRILGSETFFTRSDFENEVKNNHFGLLICFYLVPLSMCVSDPSELFKIDAESEEVDETEALKKAVSFLKNNVNLSSVLGGYLEEIKATSLFKLK